MNNKSIDTISLKDHETNIHFSLKRMEDIHDKQGGTPDDPHRHDYYTIIWPLKSVNGKHIIDFHEYNIKRNGIFFIQPGQVHQIMTKSRPLGYVITFSPEFLTQAKIEKSFIDNLKLFSSFLYNEPLMIDRQKEEKLRIFVNSMEEATKSVHHYIHETIGAYLKLFLIECVSVCDADIKREKDKSKLIVEEFKKLVEKNFCKEHKVQFYSNKLIISPGHLNFTIKKELGINAKSYIQERITIEAKRLFLFSQLNAKEMAFKLGFNDPHHFSKFIKNQTGLTISQFIEKYKRSH
jgi:AraC-like DNA-binding protein